MVREWDPATASAAELDAVIGTINQVLAVDLPEDPQWVPDRFREYLAVTMPDQRRVTWVALGSPAGEIVGHATMLLMDDIGVLELVVRPKSRRHGIGRALLGAATRLASEQGFSSIGVEVVGGTPAVEFFEAHGFRCAFVEVRNVLDLSSVDWLRLGEMARGIGSGYRIEYHPGGPPESLFGTYAQAKEAVRETELGDLELRPSSQDPERLRVSLRTLHARGLKPYIVLAVHEQSGSVAGLTEVVVPAQRPTRADQYDTIVLPSHRGYGIGRALKARMLFELRAAEPQLLDVQTWNAMENEPMLKVNTELGFQPDRQWREYEVDVAELAARLDLAG
ncbi:MAG TPA: GNAT family N-acetyltransferase [Micromonosporaceae bacterium]|nr:GNAT family N-acetyltransferase [Micromonosporaceae bacterium]